MAIILLGEYRNQNSNRAYPFADSATLVDDSGFDLPVDFVLDAFLYPIDLEGAPYLHSIDTAAGKIYFASNATDEVFAYADYTSTSESIYVYETGPYERQIGVLVLGSGLSSIVGGATLRTFTYEATALCPTAYIPLNQPGVRGILLDDGTLVTGDILITGGPGVTVTSYEPMGPGVADYIVFDMYGTLPPTPEECGGFQPISYICFVRASNSMFSLTPYIGSENNVMSISGYGFSQDDICKPQRDLRLPSDTGELPPAAYQSTPCAPIPPPTPPTPGAETCDCMAVANMNGILYLEAFRSPSYTNPISISGISGTFGQTTFLQDHPVASVSEVSADVARMNDPVTTADAIKISIRGMTKFRGSK